MVEHAAVTIGHIGQRIEEAGKYLRVIALDLGQTLLLVGIVGMVRNGMKGIRHANVVVGLLADFRRDHEALDARQVALISQRDEAEHELQVFIKVVRGCTRRLRQLQAGQVTVACVLHATFYFAHAVQVVAEGAPILGTQLPIQ